MKSKLPLLTMLAGALALAGCTTVGPNFKEPQAVSAAAYRHAGGTDQARLPAEWWTVFNDATLDSLEQRAVRDNPGVKASAQRLLQAQSQLGVTRAGSLPQVGVSAGVSNSRTSSNTSQGLALGHRSIEG